VTVEVRIARIDEHEAAIAVWAAADTARRHEPPPAEVPDTLRQRFARDDVWLLVAVDDGQVVGVTQGWPAREDDGAGAAVPGRSHLSLVFVDPRRWGEGIGGLLVDAALEHARELGHDTVQLFTHQDNDRARALYTSRGFTHDGVVQSDAWGNLLGRWSRALDPPQP